jgi:hypothetical protein
MPSPHETAGLSRYLAHDGVPEATDGDPNIIYIATLVCVELC